MKPLAYILAFLKAAVLMLGVSGCNDVDTYKRATEEGRRAFEAGIPATANPYIGNKYYVRESRLWLNSYIEAKTEAEAKNASD